MNLGKFFDGLGANTIANIAGVGYRDGIPAKEADAGFPLGLLRRRDGDLIVADYKANRLWRIDQEGVLHTLAGDGVPGSSGDGGPATEARINQPHDLCRDKEGNIYFPDYKNSTIRRIDYETGVISRVAGSGKRGRGGDGGPALEAELAEPNGVAVDDQGNIYLVSTEENNVRRVDAKTGIISTFAGYNARYYPSERGTSRPYSGGIEGATYDFEAGLSLGGWHGDGGPAKEAGFNHPEHLAFDSKGDLYVCDSANHRIRKIDMKSGIITTVLGNGQPASNGDGGPATEASILAPDSVGFDVHDNLYVSEKWGFRVRKVDAKTGIVTTVVGTGIPVFGADGDRGPDSAISSPEAGIWADPDGTVFWCDCSGRVRRCDGRTGVVTTVLGGTSVHDGEQATEGFLNSPAGVCVGPDNHIYIADGWGARIRAIDPKTGIIRTVVGSGARAFGGDNGPATEAHLCNPQDVSVDSRGRIVIADVQNGGYIRRVDEDGIIRTIAGTSFNWDTGDGGPAIGASLFQVQAVAHGANDDIYLGDAIGRIRRIDAATGTITTVAGIGLQGYSGDGGPAIKARIGAPSAIRFDAAGNLYFSDGAYHVVRKVDTEGIITTVVGCGEAGFSPDGTPAREARLSRLWGLAVSADGVAYVSDSRNNRVRRVTLEGVLETVAGSAEPGDSGDGGPATEASLNEPRGLCLYGDDVLLISDHYSNRVKAVKLDVS